MKVEYIIDYKAIKKFSKTVEGGDMNTFFFSVECIFGIVGLLMIFVALYKINPANYSQSLTKELADDLPKVGILGRLISSPLWLTVGGIVFIVVAIYITVW